MSANDRYVILGLARPRASWFSAVAQWATSASIPADFEKCVSAEELRVRLGSGRLHSAVLLDAALPAADRDLIDAARQAGCLVIIVDDRPNGRDWIGLGAGAVLGTGFDRQELMAALATAPRISRADAIPGPEGLGFASEPAVQRLAPVAMVCGSGGTGASTVASALAQGLAARGPVPGDVLLADLALEADLGVLHDAGDVVPGVLELVDAHRVGRPTSEQIRAMTFWNASRGHFLLLGLRRPRDWAALRPRSFDAAFTGLRASFGTVVCDVDADLDGERETGSVELEERNVMARTVAATADVAYVVGTPGIKGLHSLVRIIDRLIAFGLPASAIVPVVNRGPRNPRAKAEIASAVAALRAGPEPVLSPLFLPERKVDEAFRDGAPLPAQLVSPLVGAWSGLVGRAARRTDRDREPVAVVPGSLGSWVERDEEML